MRWIFRLLGAIVLALVVVVAGLFLLPQDKIARIAADQIRAQTGREVDFGNDVRLSFWPVLGVETGPVTLGNADWAADGPMLTASHLAVGVSAVSLLSGDIRITQVVAEQPVLRLEQGADGRVNWDFGATGETTGSTTSTPSTSSSRQITLERLQLQDARLIYRQAGSVPVELDGIGLTLNWPEPNGVADIRLALAPAGEAITVAAQVADFGAFLEGKAVPVTADVKMPGGGMEFIGRAGTAGDISGRASIKATDTARMVASAGLGAVEIPQGAGRSAEARADMTYAPDGKLALRNLDMTLDGNRLTGAADVELSGIPRVTAELAGKALDFSAIGGPSTAGRRPAPAAVASEGWSTEPIDASALGLADASVSLTADSIRTPMTDLGKSHVVVTVEQSRAVLQLVRVEGFGGVLSGDLVANNRKGLSVRGRLKAEGIEASKALGDMAGYDRLSGTTSIALEFLGSGASEDAIMRSLSGKGAMTMGRGLISGVNLDTLMSTGTGSGGTTVFDSLSASFAMQAGDLQNDDLAMTLPNYRADGKGRIGIGARDIDYLITPVALRARSGEGLAIPIRIKGPWANPRIVPDLDAVLEAAAGVDREGLKQQAKYALQQKLSEELDMAPDDGRDPEEVLKDTLEEEAKKGLLKLLGRN